MTSLAPDNNVSSTPTRPEPGPVSPTSAPNSGAQFHQPLGSITLSKEEKEATRAMMRQVRNDIVAENGIKFYNDVIGP